MEIFSNKFLNLLGIALNGLAEVPVVEGAELGDDAVDHRRREDAVLLKHLALLFQTVGRSHAGVGQLGERSQTASVLGSVDIHVDVGAFGHFEGIRHLEAVTAGDAKTSQKLI